MAGVTPRGGYTTAQGAFARLSTLLEGLSSPPGVEPMAMHLGEVQARPPHLLLRPLGTFDAWGEYPPPGGTPQLRTAYAGWLRRRFALLLEERAELAVEPSAGSKHAVASLIALAAQRVRQAHPEIAAFVALPNPYYPTYGAATEAAGATSLHYDPAPAQVLDSLRTIIRRAGPGLAAVVLCHPCSPTGEVYAPVLLRRIIAATRAACVPLFVDECYIDCYIDRAPVGVLQLIAGSEPAAAGVVALHTLSKRSGAPGLRCGFVAGDADWVDRFARFNRSCGVGASRPACEAAALLWADDAHAQALRGQLHANWQIADRVLDGVEGYTRAESGFYLWLRVADDEESARRAWARAGVRVMPGSYLGQAVGGRNPGSGFLRAALVHPPSVTEPALYRLRSAIQSAPGVARHPSNELKEPQRC